MRAVLNARHNRFAVLYTCLSHKNQKEHPQRVFDQPGSRKKDAQSGIGFFSLPDRKRDKHAAEYRAGKDTGKQKPFAPVRRRIFEKLVHQYKRKREASGEKVTRRDRGSHRDDSSDQLSHFHSCLLPLKKFSCSTK